MAIIYDDVFDKNTFNEISSFLTSGDFPWYRSFIDPPDYKETQKLYQKESNKSVSAKEIQFNNQFVNVLYDPNTHNRKPELSIFYPVFEFLKVNALIRVKCNLTSNTSENFKGIFHQDYIDYQGEAPDSKIAILYINTCNGFTLFKDTGERVFSKANRILTFSNTLFHTGVTCTDASSRIVVNFNYY